MKNNILNSIMQAVKSQNKGVDSYAYPVNEEGLVPVKTQLDTTVVPLDSVKNALLGKEDVIPPVHLVVRSNAVFGDRELLLESVSPIISKGLKLLNSTPREVNIHTIEETLKYLYGYEEQVTKERWCCIYANIGLGIVEALIEYKSKIIEGVEVLQEVTIDLVFRDRFDPLRYEIVKRIF